MEFRVFYDDVKNEFVAEDSHLWDTGRYSPDKLLDDYRDFAAVLALAEAIGYSGDDLAKENDIYDYNWSLKRMDRDN